VHICQTVCTSHLSACKLAIECSGMNLIANSTHGNMFLQHNNSNYSVLLYFYPKRHRVKIRAFFPPLSLGLASFVRELTSLSSETWLF